MPDPTQQLDLSDLSKEQLSALSTSKNPTQLLQQFRSPKNTFTAQMPEGDIGKELGMTLAGSALGGVQGFQVGGLIGAAAGAGLGAIMHPSDMADLASDAAATAMPWGKFEKLIGGMGLGGKTIARMGAGAAQTVALDKIREMFNGEPHGNLTKVLSSGAPALLGPLMPAAVGSISDAAQGVGNLLPRLQGQKGVLSANIQKTLDDLQSGVPQDAIANPPGHIRASLNDIQSQFTKTQAQQQATKQALSAAKNSLSKLDKERAEIIASTQYSSPEDSIYRQALLSKNDAERDKFLKMTGIDPQDMNDAHFRISNIQDAQAKLKQLKNNINPYGPSVLSQAESDALKAQLQDTIDTHQFILWNSKADELRQASEANANNNAAFDVNMSGTKRVQATMDGLKKELSDNPWENQYLKNLMVTKSGQPLTPQEFINTLASKDTTAESINALTEFVGKKGSEQQLQAIKDGVMAKMFSDAYDPKTQNAVGKLQQIVGPGGAYNQDKLIALYGGGQTGRNALDSIKQLTDDLGALDKVQQQIKNIPPSGHSTFGKIIWGGAMPTGVMLHYAGVPSHIVAATEGLGLFVAAYPKIVDAVVNNPKFAQSFHNFAMAGGTAAAFRAEPMLENWLMKNATVAKIGDK